MRILHLVLSLDPGGTERLVIEIAKALSHRAATEVVCLDHAGSWAHELRDAGIPVSALGRRPGFRPELARQVRSRLNGGEPVALHCHHYTPYVYGALAALGKRSTRIVYTEHGRLSDARPSTKRRLANAAFGRLPGRIFAVSADLREHMIGEGLPARRVEVLHNGVVPGEPATGAERAAVRAALGLATDDFAFVTVARLTPVKDLETLVRAFATLAAGSRRARLFIVGDGPERGALEALAGQTGCADSCRFLGHRDDARAVLAGMDAYVNSSIIEGISVTILEAMAAGLPVVATRVGGNPEVVLDGATGALVPSRDASALREALRGYLADPGRRAEHGARGRDRLVRDFSFDRMLHGYSRAYGLGE